MARGGINKVLVQKARTALLIRGQRPSIDAVRIELGNTGSKTTISRYLKELEVGPETAGISREERLSTPLLDVVAELVAALDDEAQITVERAREQFAEEKIRLETTLEVIQKDLEQREQDLTTLQTRHSELENRIKDSEEQLSKERRVSTQLSAKVQELTTQLTEKQTQIGLLTDAHEHARAALEHYRNAGQRQREDLIRQYDAQLHHLHAEIKALGTVREAGQHDIICLNRANERLVLEIKTLTKSAHDTEQRSRLLEQQYDALQVAYQKLGHAEAQTKNRLAKAHMSLNTLKLRFEVTTQEKQALEIQMTQLSPKV